MPLVPAVDHILAVVADLAGAGAAFERLGFTLTERGRHTGAGTHNRLAMLGDDYLELIAVETPSEWNASWRRLLDAGYQGPAALALGCDDDEAAARHLAAIGIANGPSMRLSRQVRLPEGERKAEFGIVRIAADAFPCGSMFFCRHFTRDVVWRPEWQRHANGATGIRRVIAIHPKPAEATAAYARLVGADAVTKTANGIVAGLGRTPLEILTPEACMLWSKGRAMPNAALPARLVGYTLAVADLAATERHLAGAGIPTTRTQRSIFVGPIDAAGAIIEFAA